MDCRYTEDGTKFITFSDGNFKYCIIVQNFHNQVFLTFLFAKLHHNICKIFLL